MRGIAERAYRQLKFLLSLPERSLRALAAVASGTTMLLTETLIPEPLRASRTYRITIGMMQTYIVERIAQVVEATDGIEDDLPDDFIQRKMVGTVLETAGLFLVGASPLWIFAVLADASGGGRAFLDRLTAQLKDHDVIDRNAEFNRLEDVLDAVQHASSKTATVIDTPPLSRVELRTMLTEMQAHYADTFRSAVDLVPTLESLWRRIERLAGQDRSLFNRLLGMMTVDALELGRKGGRTAASVGATGLELFDEGILRSYRRTLSAVSRQGPVGYLRSHYAPYLQAARGHFDANRWSWTERSLGGAYSGSAEPDPGSAEPV